MTEAEELEDRIAVDLTRLKPGGEILEGEADVIDLEETYVHPFGGVRYRLKAQAFGTELLVRGHVEQDFELVCSRCGKDFDTTIAVDDFVESYEINEKVQEIVLTNDVRDAIILNLPSYPVCDEACPGVEMKAQMPFDDRWSALDGVATEEERSQEHGES